MPIRDTRLMARALEQRWPISDAVRKAVIRRLVSVVMDPKSSPREATAASKAILSAESQNQADEHKLVDVSISARNIELDAIAADLGIEVSFIEAASRSSEGSDRGATDSGANSTDRVQG